MIGPNSPLYWVKKCVEFLCSDKERRAKILTGLNFYGNDYTPDGGGPIVGAQFINLIKNLKGKMHYDADSGENYFDVKYVLIFKDNKNFSYFFVGILMENILFSFQHYFQFKNGCN